MTVNVLLNRFCPRVNRRVGPLNSNFIGLVGVVVTPIVFYAIMANVTNVRDVGTINHANTITLLCFRVIDAVTLVVNLVVIGIIRPNTKVGISPTALSTGTMTICTSRTGSRNVITFVVSIVPTDIVNTFTDNGVLRILLFTMLFNFTLRHLNDGNRLVFGIVRDFSRIVFNVVGVVVHLTPVNTFKTVTFAVNGCNINALIRLKRLVVYFCVAYVLFIILMLNSVTGTANFDVFGFVHCVHRRLLVMLKASSSRSTLPHVLSGVRGLNYHGSIIKLIVPANCSFGLSNASVCLAVTTIFVTRTAGDRVSVIRRVALLVILLLSSGKTTKMANDNFVILTTALSTINRLPMTNLTLVLNVSHFVSRTHTLAGLINGNMTAVIITG